MTVKGLIIKYSYLIKSIVSLCIAIYIPIFIFELTIVQHSCDKIIKENEDSYKEITSSFASYFDQQIGLLRKNAIMIYLDNTLDNALAKNKIIKETIESHPYYASQAIKDLSDYKSGLSNTIELGIYFVGTDYIITSAHKYMFNDFLNIFSDATEEHTRQMTDFFMSESDKMRQLSTFSYKDYTDAKLFIGIPVTLNEQHKSLIFYVMRYDSIDTSFLTKNVSDPLRLCIFDYNGKLLYTNKLPKPKLFENEDFVNYIIDSGTNIFRYEYDGKNYIFFKNSNMDQGQIFVSYIPQDYLEKNLTQFRYIIRNITILISFFLAIILSFAVYINYTPILKLVKKIGKSQKNGLNSEMKSISCAFSQMEENIAEQKIILMDYLLGNLLYGMPISPADVDNLDMNIRSSNNFCVLTIQDLKMNNTEREQLSDTILLKYDINTYITDVLNKNLAVFICILKNDDISAFVADLKQLLYTKYNFSHRIGVGHIVHQLNDIHKSYMNSLHVMELTNVDVNLSDSKISVIENYPFENITLFLNYVKNGEKDNALNSLSIISQYILNEIDTFFIQQYICYDILISYIKCIKQINYPLHKNETIDLISHNTIKEFFDSLSASVKTVCDSIKQYNESMYNRLQREIIEYVNSNYTDPEICRTQVATRYNISVYSLSRLFKDSLGIGFKEYIIAKRLELSKHLLLTTNKSIVQITSEIGLDDPGYFSRIFNITYNMPPSKFRDLYSAG